MSLEEKGKGNMKVEMAVIRPADVLKSNSEFGMKNLMWMKG